jgi:hypothetical protein
VTAAGVATGVAGVAGVQLAPEEESGAGQPLLEARGAAAGGVDGEARQGRDVLGAEAVVGGHAIGGVTHGLGEGVVDGHARDDGAEGCFGHGKLRVMNSGR